MVNTRHPPPNPATVGFTWNLAITFLSKTTFLLRILILFAGGGKPAAADKYLRCET